MDSNLPDDPTVRPESGAVEAPSAGVVRFNSCRWQRAAEGDVPACCGHRDVLPMAGTSSFNPDAWCPGCEYYKVKRAPKARPPAPAYPRWND